MRGSKYLAALSVAVVIGAMGVAPALAGGGGEHRDDQGGAQIGPLGQVFANPSYNAGEARAFAEPRQHTVRARAAAAAAYGSAAGSEVTIDPLAMQHKDKDWKHNYQSWCDVDPSCNGWAAKMQEYEQSRQ
jgi:hypothetical protein